MKIIASCDCVIVMLNFCHPAPETPVKFSDSFSISVDTDVLILCFSSHMCEVHRYCMLACLSVSSSWFLT